MPRYMHEFAETPREAFVRGVAEERARVVALLQERLTAMGEHAYLFQRDILAVQDLTEAIEAVSKGDEIM